MSARWLMTAVLFTAACTTNVNPASPGSAVDSNVVGTWVATQGSPAGVTAVFNADGTFTWSNGNVSGTFEADGSTLTLNFPADSSFCASGNLVWDFVIEAETMTADIVGGECDGEPIIEEPPSPDWIFQRQ
jgi:hypothetical protein